MTHRCAPATSAPKLRALPFTGLRSAFAEGYGARDLRSDVLAGLVVGVVALPLSMALAIASVGAGHRGARSHRVAPLGGGRRRHGRHQARPGRGASGARRRERRLPFFGGIAATGAIARTATGIRYGSRSPIATIVHAVVVLAAVPALAPVISYLPMASLAALLLLVAWNMSEAKHFFHMVRVAPKSDVAVLLTCYFLTVVFDMVIAVTAGMVLAAFLFMRRMAEVASWSRKGTRTSRSSCPS